MSFDVSWLVVNTALLLIFNTVTADLRRKKAVAKSYQVDVIDKQVQLNLATLVKKTYLLVDLF